MKLTKKQWHDKTGDAVMHLIYLKDELARLGLLRTMHKLDLATEEVGYEMADILTGKQHTVDAFLKRRKK